MATFSISDAVGSGFGLIGRKPLVILAWGLAYLILAVGPAAGLMAWVGPDFMSMMQQAIVAGVHHTPPATSSPLFWQMQSKLGLLQPVMFLTSLAARAILCAAVFRAVLEPENGGFAYLRLGAQELWLALLMLAATILAVIFCLLLMIPVGAVTAAAAFAVKGAHLGQGWSALVICLGVLAYFVVFVWVLLRFSLAAPMTFAAREFRLFESWSLTKGHAWKLFGLALVLFVILVAVGLVVDCILVIGVLASLGMSSFDPTAIAAFFQQPPAEWAPVIAPWLIGFAIVGSFLGAAIMAIAIAPWAVVYRELTADSAPASPAQPEPAAEGGHG